MKISLTLVVVLLLLAIVVILTQHGRATLLTWLSLVPLGAYLLVWAIACLVAAIRR